MPISARDHPDPADLSSAAPLFRGTPPHVVVIGAGAFGGWTALHLQRMGARVTLIDAWGPGNSRASSGGETRIIRAVYGPDRAYVEMVRRSFDWWGALDATVDEKLYVETGTLWMIRGDDGYVRSSVPILEDLDFPIDALPVEEAARRHPHIDFRGVRSVWFERRAGALFARRACVAVRDAFLRAGGTYRTAHAQLGPARDSALTSVQLHDGTSIAADAFVFACGPWLGQLFPDVLGEAIRPSRQEVFFFGVPRGSDAFAAGRMPTWIDFGERIFYGVPDLSHRGFKVADDTRGETVDPTSLDRTPWAEALRRARALLAERFPALRDAPLLESRVCQYENSPDGNLIVDRHPSLPNVWLAGGGSGHGFKLSPAVGELVARMLLADAEPPPLFRLERLRAAAPTQTQFDRKPIA